MKLVFFLTLATCFSVSANVAIEAFISAQHKVHDPELVSDDEFGELRYVFSINDEHVVLLWTYKTGNYWQNNLTLLNVTDKAYTEISTTVLPGIVDSAYQEGTLVTIQTRNYTEGDPRCCPSEKREIRLKLNQSGYETL